MGLRGICNYLSASTRYMEIVTAMKTSYPREAVEFHAKAGRIKLLDALFLRYLLRWREPKRILEVGSFLGFSTYWLLLNTVELGSRVTAIDPNIRHRIFESPRSYLERVTKPYRDRLDKITAFLGDYGASAYYDYEHYEPKMSRADAQAVIDRTPVLKDIEGRFDFVFIDGEHSYEATMSNFRSCLKSLDGNGVIAFHDALAWPGVAKTLEELKLEFAKTATVLTLGGRIPELCDGIGVFHLKG